ncbi:MAG: tol-pal system-associated acyl-CoA thioesterase [Nevskiaceae bacterium]|nr:MAG: tol-pal system-associated acyl-CoA thioesterase [Nevskiaceae bacterium]TBR74079.1 MAG: tol-pal system-associated acyl-CoA thioesterase [Nevskiaceae bacterium]
MPISIPVRVYYEDTDASGVVYHAAYLRYFERARTEWVRSLGLSQQALMQEFGVAFTVSALSVEYLRPARLDDLLQVDAAVDNIRRASLEFVQTVVREDGAVLARAHAHVACVSTARFRPCGLPAGLRERMALGSMENSASGMTTERSGT